MKRMVGPAGQEKLADRLIVWPGPLPFDVATEPRKLLEFAHALDVGTLVIDSLKDIAVDLEKGEVGARVNLAIQLLIADGIEVCLLHHPRKAQAGEQDKPKTLNDVYGSRWLTAGMGSILLVWGSAGDPVVTLSHLKQPEGELGPLRVLHDHDTGTTTPYEQQTLGEQLARAAGGLTVTDAACGLFGTDAPSASQREKTRRRLEKLIEAGLAERRDEPEGTARYRARAEAA
jgi:hypothetical protein